MEMRYTGTVAKEKIAQITLADTAYPPLLKQINDPPEKLYVRGNAAVLSGPHMLASVGSRKASAYGKQAIGLLLPVVVRANVVIVSGMAYGVDALSHKIAVEYHKPTIAVLGGGVDDATMYPHSHKKLAQEILEHGGAIISEWPAETPARPAHFLQRNRIIAGLTQATLVVQAATKSGSLVTAKLALDYNREVLAVPGPINEPVAQGTNWLIHEGATPAISPQDIFAALHIESSDIEEDAPENLGEEQATVFTHLSKQPSHVDDITGLVKLPPQRVASLLLELELSGHAQHVGGMKYIRK